MAEAVISDGRKDLSTPVPVRFVHNGRIGARRAIGASDFDKLLAEDPEVLRAFAENGDLCWTVQTFCRLREAGYRGIELATAPAPERINISKSKTLSRRGWKPGVFDVSIQADYPHVAWARFHLQQNRDMLGRDASFIQLWPQTNLIRRSGERSGIRRAGFFGKIDGNLALDEEAWRGLLAERGIEFVSPPAASWHDYSKIDVAVGIRSFDARRHSRKPANKLINAWLAGVPFIGGNDSAFAQIGSPGEDYLQAQTPEEVVQQIDRLQSDPALYASLAHSGALKAAAFAVPKIVQEWVAVLEGPVSARYRQWDAHPVSERASAGLLSAAQAGFDLAKSAGRKMLGRSFEA